MKTEVRTETSSLRSCSFSPEKYMVEIQNTFTGKSEKYLPVNARIAWFLTYCKEHRITPMFRPNVYFDRTVFQYIATVEVLMNGEVVAIEQAAKVYNPKEPATYAALMSAITAAKGRALADLGFGTLMSEMDEGNDGIPADTGIPTLMETPCPTDADAPPERIPDWFADDEYPDFMVEPEAEPKSEPKVKTEPKRKPKEKLVDAEPLPEFEPEPEKTLPKMSLEEARAFVVDRGTQKGMTLGELAATKPTTVKFYAEKMNLTETNAQLIAAAKVIVEEVGL